MMRIAVVLMAVLFGACATGFDRGAVQERLAGEKLVVTDAAIREALEKKPQIRFPIKVAVHMIADTYRPEHSYEPREEWRWTVEDKETVAKWAESLKKSGVVADMFVMSDLVATSDDLREVRLAAAKHGADMVLVIKGVAQVDRYANPLAMLNLLIVPGYFVPGSNRDVLLMMKGAMWDVANEYLYLTVDAEVEEKEVGPTFRIETTDVIDQAKVKALHDFGDELIARMNALKGAVRW